MECINDSYYYRPRDNCRVIELTPNLDCNYSDICVRCEDTVSHHCLECNEDSEELTCLRCAGNRILPFCHCPEHMVPDPTNPEYCIECAKGRYYNITMDACRDNELLANLGC